MSVIVSSSAQVTRGRIFPASGTLHYRQCTRAGRSRQAERTGAAATLASRRRCADNKSGKAQLGGGDDERDEPELQAPPDMLSDVKNGSAPAVVKGRAGRRPGRNTERRPTWRMLSDTRRPYSRSDRLGGFRGKRGSSGPSGSGPGALGRNMLSDAPVMQGGEHSEGAGSSGAERPRQEVEKALTRRPGAL